MLLIVLAVLYAVHNSSVLLFSFYDRVLCMPLITRRWKKKKLSETLYAIRKLYSQIIENNIIFYSDITNLHTELPNIVTAPEIFQQNSNFLGILIFKI